jgi:hypothetical protein
MAIVLYVAMTYTVYNTSHVFKLICIKSQNMLKTTAQKEKSCRTDPEFCSYHGNLTQEARL